MRYFPCLGSGQFAAIDTSYGADQPREEFLPCNFRQSRAQTCRCGWPAEAEAQARGEVLVGNAADRAETRAAAEALFAEAQADVVAEEQGEEGVVTPKEAKAKRKKKADPAE